MRSRWGSRAAAVAKGSGGGRGPRGVARLVAREHVEQLGGLGDRVGEHAVLHEEVVALLGTARDPPAGGLQADEPAARGRDPDRPAAVAAVGERHHARRHGGRGAAGRAARRALGVPGVAGRPEAARLGHRQDPELGQVGLADDHEAGLAQPPDHERVVPRNEVAEDVGAERVGHAGDRRGVLDRDRHPRERPLVPRPDRVGRGEGALGVDVHERVEVAVELVDAVERGLGQLARAELALAHQRRELAGRPEQEVGVHRRREPNAPAGGEPRGLVTLSLQMKGESDRPTVDERLAALAGRQYGVVTRQQLRRLGAGDTGIEERLRSRRLHRLHRGVYAVGHSALRSEAHWMAAVLTCGDGAVLSHASAAAHWEIRRSSAATIDVTVPVRSGRRSRPGSACIGRAGSAGTTSPCTRASP